MPTGSELYRPSTIAGTVFNRMLQCGPDSNYWLEHALKHCLPYEVLEQWQDRIAFISAERHRLCGEIVRAPQIVRRSMGAGTIAQLPQHSALCRLAIP